MRSAPASRQLSTFACPWCRAGCAVTLTGGRLAVAHAGRACGGFTRGGGHARARKPNGSEAAEFERGVRLADVVEKLTYALGNGNEVSAASLAAGVWYSPTPANVATAAALLRAAPGFVEPEHGTFSYTGEMTARDGVNYDPAFKRAVTGVARAVLAAQREGRKAKAAPRR